MDRSGSGTRPGKASWLRGQGSKRGGWAWVWGWKSKKVRSPSPSCPDLGEQGWNTGISPLEHQNPLECVFNPDSRHLLCRLRFNSLGPRHLHFNESPGGSEAEIPRKHLGWHWPTLTGHSFVQFSSLSRVQLFGTPWTVGRQASLSIANSQSLLKLMSIQSAMSFNHLRKTLNLFLAPRAPRHGASHQLHWSLLAPLVLLLRSSLEPATCLDGQYVDDDTAWRRAKLGTVSAWDTIPPSYLGAAVGSSGSGGAHMGFQCWLFHLPP